MGVNCWLHFLASENRRAKSELLAEIVPFIFKKSRFCLFSHKNKKVHLNKNVPVSVMLRHFTRAVMMFNIVTRVLIIRTGT